MFCITTGTYRPPTNTEANHGLLHFITDRHVKLPPIGGFQTFLFVSGLFL